MIGFTFQNHRPGPLNILCLGAHSDDIEIGCGGTLLTLLSRHPASNCHWVVFSAENQRRAETEHAMGLFTEAAGELRKITCKAFPDGFMPFVGAEIKSVFEELKRGAQPDVIFTHYRRDAHQDHRLLSEITASTFRDHLILEYEIPKYDGDMGSPNVFVPLTDEHRTKKVDYLFEAFASQQDRHWFQRETFSALMRLRGMECASPSGYAEAFYCRKVVL